MSAVALYRARSRRKASQRPGTLRNARTPEPSSFDWVYAGLFLVLGFSANIRFLQSDSTWAVIYAVSMVAIVSRRHGKVAILPAGPMAFGLLGFMLIVALSGTWSTYPQESILSIGALFGTTLLGVYIANTFTLRQLLDLTQMVLLAMALCSIVLIVLLPDVAVHTESLVREWRGMFLHKNALGKSMALLAGLSIISIRLGTRYRGLSWLGLVVAIFLLSGADSDEGLLLTLVLGGAMVLLPGKNVLSREVRLALTLTTLLFLSAAVAVAYPLIQFIGGNPLILSGRVEIWNGVLEAIANKPLQGYGYGGFWHGYEPPSLIVMERMTGYIPFHAHNSLLELLVLVGVFGTAFFCVFFGAFVIKTGVCYLRAPSTAHQFALLIGLTALAQSLVSVSIPGYQNSLWILVVAISIRISVFSEAETASFRSRLHEKGVSR